MTNQKLVKLAERYCTQFHRGQTRKEGHLPYSTHPFAVREILVKYGYDEPEVQIIALLHDTLEDTELIKNKQEIEKKFGSYVYDGVYRLSKNTVGKHAKELSQLFKNLCVDLSNEKDNLTSQAYELRILFSRTNIQRIKLADMIHNTSSLPALSKKGIERKITDAENFYIPLGEVIAPEMVKELIDNINKYKSSEHYKQTFG